MQAVDALQQIVDRTAVTVILQVRIRGVAQCRQFIHVGLQLVAGGLPVQGSLQDCISAMTIAGSLLP